MKSFFLIALMAIPATAMAVEDHDKYEAYKQRRAERRAYALEARRQYNASKGPHVYRTAIAAPAPITPFLAIEKGWVRQPAIPVVPAITVGYPRARWFADTVHYAHPPAERVYAAAQRRFR